MPEPWQHGPHSGYRHQRSPARRNASRIPTPYRRQWPEVGRMPVLMGGRGEQREEMCTRLSF